MGKKIIIAAFILFISIFIIENSGLEYWLFKQQNHFSDCDYWKSKTDSDILNYFQDKDDYVKIRAVSAFIDCNIKQATPFIVSTFAITESPPDKYNYFTIYMKSPLDYKNRLQFGLFLLWNFPINVALDEKNKFKGQSTIDFWNNYYKKHDKHLNDKGSSTW